ncbi:hypothetical protein B0T25DRAFT_523385 [Lasiosphaeria hispida]|uniref:DUF6536 domain-containing protein n=1 Tax=Lasiosphaeria hispida TaxID=260671 RepID=A0AAJ0M7L9_9PEZI|nr:hypothetical protein B0T25DRAFT_523385 [Lasiosphaeria hispida]
MATEAQPEGLIHRASRVSTELEPIEPKKDAADVEVTSDPKDGTDSFRATRFAEKTKLAWWFPQILDDETKNWRIWLSRRSRAILIQIGVVGLIFTTNLGLTIFAVSRYGSQNGVGLIYEGDCDKVRTLDQWIHLLINLLGTGMLSASNYCMQLQAAPTRANINRAHQNGKWLDIGIPSLRNLKYISNWRRASWVLLALSSVPIHLIYNSAVFQSLSSSEYTVAVVRDSFLNGTSWNLTAAEERRKGSPGWDLQDGRLNPPSFDYNEIIQGMQTAAKGGLYTQRNLSACFDLFNNYWQPQGNALVLVQNETVQLTQDDSVLMYVSVIPRSDDWAKNMWALENGTNGWVALQPPLPVTKWLLGPPQYEASHCLVQPPEQLQTRCRFEYSPQIMFTVCFMNFIKASIMLSIWVLRRWQEPERFHDEKEVLYTLGDAIASFMRNPDNTTINMGLATKYDFLTTRTWRGKLIKHTPTPSQEPREFKSQPKQWRSAVSLRRWLAALFAFLLVMLIAAILLLRGFVSLHHRHFSTTLPALWGLGFGSLTPYTYIVAGLPTTDPAGLVSNVLLANLPQLILSVLYIIYNVMISAFLVQREFSKMCSVRKPLRVSEPIGIQRSSYFISLPLRYGIPLYVSSGVMHWLLSQSLFLARITAITPEGTVDVVHSYSTCGYSPVAIFIAILAGIGLAAVIVGLGFRKYDGTMRMVSTNSRAISAACHVLPEDQESGFLLPVQWGVVAVSQGVGKCAFTTAPQQEMVETEDGVRGVRMPEEGKMYT